MKDFKIWDSAVLAQVLSLANQIQANISEIAVKTGTHALSNLPPSTLPTQTLYELCLCYEAMYNKLMEYDLLTTGNIKSTSTLQ